MEKIIHFTVPKKLTPIQAKAVERARVLHPSWEIKIWQDPVQPNGYLLERYWSLTNSGAQLADLLRLDILYAWGGVYIDSDLMLLRSLDDLAEKFEFFICSEDGMRLTNAAIGVKRAHPAVRALIEELLTNEPDWSVRPDITTGPGLFARVLKWHREMMVLPRETFYGYQPSEKHFGRNHRHAYGEHLWEHSWKASRWTGQSNAKRIGKSALTGSFETWQRIKSLYQAISEQHKLSEPKVYGATSELVVKTTDGFTMLVDGKDISVTPELVFGTYEPRMKNFVKRALHGGDWAIDVGANVGYFSLMAAQVVGSFGRVFSFEPNPRPLKLLSKSMVLNWMHDRIVTRPVAVGEFAGRVSLAFLPERLGDAQVGHEDLSDSTFAETLKILGAENLTTIDVTSVKLDDEFPVDLPIKLLKIDVEGYDAAVLKGARRLLERRCVDFILIEVLREVAGSRWGELLAQLEWLTQSNYTACTLEHDGTLVEHKSVSAALGRIQGRDIVLRARDQFRPGFNLISR